MRCKVEECAAEAVAKGLCSKHYMRERRHGSADTVHKCGRKPDEARALAARYLDSISPRSFTRYWQAMKILRFCGEDTQEAIKEASNSYGSVNKSHLYEIAITAFAKWLQENEKGK
jgi:hypothetical protein